MLNFLRQWIDSIEVHDPRIARFFCRVIPSQCPFERHIKVFNYTLFQIPPLCKLNPFYEQLVGVRWRSLSFLANECGEN